MIPTLFARLTRRAVVTVDGPDWRGFLQNLLSQDVEGLTPGAIRAALLLTPQGRFLFDLFVIAQDHGARLDVQADRRDELIQRLRLYRLRAKIEIEADETPIWAAWGEEPPAGAWMIDPRLEGLGWRGYGQDPPAGAKIANEAAYDHHRLGLGVPDPARDCVPDKTFPLEANYDLLNAIDFHKGCFVGQETTSRMKRRSAVKSRMAPITFDGPAPAFGTPVMAGDLRAGEVLSGAEGRAMALVRLDRAMGGDLRLDARPGLMDIPPWWPTDALPSSGDSPPD